MNCATTKIIILLFSFIAAVTAYGTIIPYTIFAGTTITSTGPTIIYGDMAMYPGTSVSGFPPAVAGTQQIANPAALLIKSSLTNQSLLLSAQPCNQSYTVATDFGGLTIVPGTYCFANTLTISGAVYLDCGNSSTATFIFNIGTGFITSTAANVVLLGNVALCDVNWNVGSSATFGTATNMYGTVLAQQSISLVSSTAVTGVLYALLGAVTMDTNTITPVGFVSNGTTASPSTTQSPTPTTSTTGAPITTQSPVTTPSPTRLTTTQSPPPTTTASPPTAVSTTQKLSTTTSSPTSTTQVPSTTQKLSTTSSPTSTPVSTLTTPSPTLITTTTHATTVVPTLSTTLTLRTTTALPTPTNNANLLTVLQGIIFTLISINLYLNWK